MRTYLVVFFGQKRPCRCYVTTKAGPRAFGPAPTTAEAWFVPRTNRGKRRRVLAENGGPLWVPARTESEALTLLIAQLSRRFGSIVDGPTEFSGEYRDEGRPLRWVRGARSLPTG